MSPERRKALLKRLKERQMWFLEPGLGSAIGKDDWQVTRTMIDVQLSEVQDLERQGFVSMIKLPTLWIVKVNDTKSTKSVSEKNTKTTGMALG